MSSIPNAKMKHAHVPDADAESATPKAGDTAQPGPTLTERAEELAGRARDYAEDAVDAIKARPGMAAAVGAAVVAGVAAIAAAPAAVRALRGDDDDKPAKKTAAKKASAKKA